MFSYLFRSFVEASFKYIGKEIEWEGEGDQEMGREKGTGEVRVKVNPKFYRPTEVEQLMGDPRKANEKLGWKPKVISISVFLRVFFNTSDRFNFSYLDDYFGSLRS